MAGVALRDLLALVREVRLLNEGTPAGARAAVMARQRAMVERLEPGWYDAGEDLTEAENELEATGMLESLAVGTYTHPDVERRPSDPKSPEWAAMVGQLRARHTAAVDALAELELDCAVYGGSFPDDLRAVLEDLAGRLGGSEALVDTRPGSWEAHHIRALAAGADYDLDQTGGGS